MFWLLNFVVAETIVTESDSLNSMDVVIQYTGDRMGAATAFYAFPSLEFWKTSQFASELMIQSRHDILQQHDWVLWNDTGDLHSVASFLELSKKEKMNCTHSNTFGGWRTEREQILVPDAFLVDEKVQELTSSYHHWTCRIDDFQIELTNTSLSYEQVNPTKLLAEWEIDDFEFKPALSIRYQDSQALVIGRSMQEISRVVEYLQSHPKISQNTIYVDAGNFVDGVSTVLPNGLSVHRKYAYDWLKMADPVALGIGENEIIDGVRNFYDEIANKDLPYIATNWVLNTDKGFEVNQQYPDLPKYQLVDVVDEEGNPHQIAFLGIIDPKLMDTNPILKLEGLSILSAVESIDAVFQEFEEKNIHPKATIILTTASSDIMEQIRRKAKGVDLMLGDVSLATLRIYERQIQLKPFDAHHKGAPVTLPSDGVQEVTLHFSRDYLEYIHHQSISIYDEMPKNEQIAKQLTKNRLPYYIAQNHVVLKREDRWNDTMTQNQWEDLVCTAVLQKTKADTVLLNELPKFRGYPGDVTEKQIADSLNIGDVVEVHNIPGASFQRFLDQSFGSTGVSCGVLPGSKSPKPRGIGIQNQMVYQVATTDATRLSSTLNLILSANQSRKYFDAQNMQLMTLPSGELYSLRQMVLDTLNSEASIPTPTEFLSHQQVKNETLWLLRLNDVSLTMDNFQSAKKSELSEVPETMLNNPSAASFGTKADVSLEQYHSKYQSFFRYQGVYSAFYLDEDTENIGKQEINDDWKFSASLNTIKPIIDMGLIGWKPYSELMFDSEFSPLEKEDGTFASKQSDLSLTMGVSSEPFKSIKNLKFGVLVNRDLAQIEEKPFEYGGSIKWNTSQNLAAFLLWSTEGNLLLYANTPDDDNSDLRWRLGLNGKLTMPFSRNFGVSLYTTGLGAQGRTVENNVIGYGWNMGASIDLLGVLDLSKSFYN